MNMIVSVSILIAGMVDVASFLKQRDSKSIGIVTVLSQLCNMGEVSKKIILTIGFL